MKRILEISICLFLSVSCYGQIPALTEEDTIELKQLEIWRTISENDILLPEYSYLDSLQFLKIKYQS
ncbi:MAG: hypothetical protein RIF34_07600, partial [Candidatus Kapaibacterium sp.]